MNNEMQRNKLQENIAGLAFHNSANIIAEEILKLVKR